MRCIRRRPPRRVVDSLHDALEGDLRDPTVSWDEFRPISFDVLFGGALDVGVECADLSSTIDVAFLLPDSPIGVVRCEENWADGSTPLSLFLAREP